MDSFTYEVIRSSRKDLRLQISDSGLRVLAPSLATKADIEKFLHRHRRWIYNRLAARGKARPQIEQEPPMSSSKGLPGLETTSKVEVPEYRVVRSKRKSLCLKFQGENLIVRAPIGISTEVIERFVLKNKRWIENQRLKMEIRRKAEADTPKLKPKDIRILSAQALKLITERVEYYAPIIGVTYGKITIRSQSTRWGSCSSKGNLNFNCLLMLTPPEVINSVVVHELCHRKEMNHSEKFYSHVLRAFPDYWKWRRWLVKNGGAIIRRLEK